MIVEEKPDIRELLGRDFSSSNLRLEARSPNATTPLMRIAALGAATMRVQYRATHDGADVRQLSSRPRDERATLAGNLAQLLWHLRYGGQYGLLQETISHVAASCAMRARFAYLTEDDRLALLPKLAAVALDEWLSDRCTVCRGCGKQERSRTGRWIRPRGSMQRNATFRPCNACHGSGRAMASQTVRRQRLGLDLERYNAERWDRHVDVAIVMLDREIRLLNRPIGHQLRIGKIVRSVDTPNSQG